MKKKQWNCIGVMSGTSLDGLDLVYVKFTKKVHFSFKIIASETIQYTDNLKIALRNAMQLSKDELQVLDKRYGGYIAQKINRFIADNSIANIDFIGSHGHTVFHDPANGITKQIGAGDVIAEQTKQIVICDFRSQDVALGGQGAPLVPIGDRLLFSKYDYCLNLGGFSNISSEMNTERIAFDICPVNIVLNVYAQKLGFAYDKNGKISASGTINHRLLEKLSALDYYKKIPPKSLGLEWVQECIFPLLDTSEDNITIILRTFVEHIAMQIAKVVTKNATVLVTGGGAFNGFLMQRITALSTAKMTLPKQIIIDYKEALIFAFLGLLRSENQINCLKSVTGALKDHSSGGVFHP